MTITASQYERLKATLAENASADPEDKLSPEQLARANDAIREFDEQFMNKGVGADTPRPPPGQSRVLAPEGAPITEQSLVEDLKRKVDPSVPLQPQVLSLRPATGHPKGDEAAKDEWVRGELDNPNGLVVVYDAPAAVVRRKILENPQILKALGYDMPLTPEAVMGIEAGSSVHRAYNDYEWGNVADAAVKGGKTPYRYSRAPWLKDGKGGSVLTTLSTKVKHGALPALDQATAFIIGQDETANFGAAGAAARAGAFDGESHGLPKPHEPIIPGAKPMGGGKDELVNAPGEDAESTGEMLDQAREEHPYLHTAGQVVGAVPGAVGGVAKIGAQGVSSAVGLASKTAGEAIERATNEGVQALVHWNPANALWEWVTDAAMATKGPALLKGVGTGAAAAGAHQAVSEGVQAGANYLGTGDTGTSLGRVGMNVANAAGMGAAFGIPGTLGQMGAAKHAETVREGTRYRQLPGRLERLGVEPQFGKGFVAPDDVKAVQAEARARPGDVRPIDIYAERLDKPLATAAKGQEAESKLRVRDSQREVFESREGRMLLPAENLVNETVGLLRKRTAPLRKGGKPTAVGAPNAANPVRGILNANIGGVSTQPLKGAIPVKVEEAEAWLNPVWRRRTLEAAEKRGAVTRPTSDPERIASPKRLGNSTELARTEPAGGLAAREEGLARVPRYGGARRPELTSSDIDKAAPDGVTRGSRRPTAGEATGSTTPRVTARNLGPDAPAPSGGARWRRRDKPAGKREKADVAVGSWGDQLRRKGIRTVYVMPRRYNAQHHESAIQLLRKSRDTNAKDRDLIQIYNAALRDRDARPWRGQPGGWSKLQQQHEQEISKAKDIRRRVSPNRPDGTYRQVVRSGKLREGQSKDVAAMQAMAERAGVADELKSARTLDPLEKLAHMMTHSGKGDVRSPLSPTGWFDQGNIKLAYPVTRQLERPGRIGEGRTGKLSLIGKGDDEAEERQQKRDKPAAKKYARETKGAREEARSPKKKRRKAPAKKTRKRKENDE